MSGQKRRQRVPIRIKNNLTLIESRGLASRFKIGDNARGDGPRRQANARLPNAMRRRPARPQYSASEDGFAARHF